MPRPLFFTQQFNQYLRLELLFTQNYRLRTFLRTQSSHASEQMTRE